MAEPIKPVSRLKDASLANSNAIAEARRATNSERHQMGRERLLQRKWRWAASRNDYAGMAAYGDQLDALKVSRTGGVGIQDSQENNRIAADRAFNRADQLNQAGGRGGAAAEPQKPAPHPFARNVGQGAADDIEAAAGAPGAAGERGTRGQTGNGTINPNARPAGTADVRQSRLLPENNPAPSSTGSSKLRPRAQFIADLDKSELFKDGDAGAIERAVARGDKFGITREQVLARQQGRDATLSGIAKEKEAIASRQPEQRDDVVLGPEAPPEDSLIAQATRIQRAGKEAKQLTDEGIAFTDKALENRSPIEDYVPEPPIARATRGTDVSGAPKAIVVQEEPTQSKPSWWNDSIESPESRVAKIKEGVKAVNDQRIASKKEYDQIGAGLIEEKVKAIEVPEWQKNTALGSINRAAQEKLIRFNGIGIEMDQRIRGIMARNEALKKADQRSKEIRAQASNLVPSQ